MCIISNPLVNSNWIHSPETLNSVRHWWYVIACEIWWMTLKTTEHLFYATLSFVQHFVAIGEFKLELQSGNAQSGSNSTIFRSVRPWNLTNDLAKQQGTSSVQLQALCIILYPLVNSNISYNPETLNSGPNRRFFLALWHRNFTDDPKKQQGISFMLLQAWCIISYPLVNLN